MGHQRKSLTDEQRAERRRQDREFALKAVEQLRSSDGWQAWLAARRHFHRYSLHNQLLIAMQRPEATRVAGFRAWLKLGYCVTKGQKAIRIWVPIPPSKNKLEAWRRAGADPAEKPPTHFRLGPVFDRSQVTALPPPAEPAPLDPPIAVIEGDGLAHLHEPLVCLASAIGCTVDHEAMAAGRGGYYQPDSRRIALNSDLAVNAQVKTLIHELGHALARVERCHEDPELDYAAEELIVESVAYSVCGSVGLDTGGYSIPYLASWSQHTPIATIEQHAALIDRLARRIETAIADVSVPEGSENQLAAA